MKIVMLAIKEYKSLIGKVCRLLEYGETPIIRLYLDNNKMVEYSGDCKWIALDEVDDPSQYQYGDYVAWDKIRHLMVDLIPAPILLLMEVFASNLNNDTEFMLKSYNKRKDQFDELFESIKTPLQSVLELHLSSMNELNMDSFATYVLEWAKEFAEINDLPINQKIDIDQDNIFPSLYDLAHIHEIPPEYTQDQYLKLHRDLLGAYVFNKYMNAVILRVLETGRDFEKQKNIVLSELEFPPFSYS